MMMTSIDENQNSYPTRDFEHWKAAKTINYHRKLLSLGFVPTPRSNFRNTSHSTKNVRKNIKTILDLMNERKSKINGDVVFVWDIGEITKATTNYVAECMLHYRSIEVSLLLRLMERIENNAKIEKSDDSKHLMDIEEPIDDESELFRLMKRIENNSKIDKSDLMNIKDVINDGSNVMKNMAHKYDVLEQFYDEISNGIRDDGPIISYDLIKKCGMEEKVVEIYNSAAQHQRQFQQRWRMARRCLKLVNERSGYKKSANFVICHDRIEHGAAQLLLSGNSDQVPIENIYSTRGASKKSIFERIQSRFGDKCVLVYVTSNPLTVPKLQKVRIATFKIEAHDTIEHLFDAQRDVFLRPPISQK